MRVCHERVGKRGGPVDGSMPGGTRLTHPHFPSAQHSSTPEHTIIFSCARPGNPAVFIVTRVDEVISRLKFVALHMSLCGTSRRFVATHRLGRCWRHSGE